MAVLRFVLLAAMVAALVSAQRTKFKATLAPLPSTTGVSLGGSGSAEVNFDSSDDVRSRGFSELSVSVANLGSPVVAWHIHRGTEKENGPIVLVGCGDGKFANVKVIDRPKGVEEKASGDEFVRNTVRCSQSASASYTMLPLAGEGPIQPLSSLFDEIMRNPGGWYVNVHTVESERIAPDKGQIRGQLVRA